MVFASQNELFWATFPDCLIRWELQLRMWWEFASAGLQLDDELPSEFRVQFLRWVDGLQVLQQWSIPNSYTGSGWSNIRGLALHAFGDASPRGYGACVYLIAEKEDGSVVPSLVIAKAKLAPLKQGLCHAWSYLLVSSLPVCWHLWMMLLDLKRIFDTIVGLIQWWLFHGSRLIPVSGRHLLPIVLCKYRLWLLRTGGSIVLEWKTLLTYLPIGLQLRNWFSWKFGCRVPSSWWKDAAMRWTVSNHQKFCVLWWLRKQLALFLLQLPLVRMCSRWRDGISSQRLFES